MKLQDTKIQEITQKAIEAGLAYSSDAWYFLDEPTAKGIFIAAIKAALAETKLIVDSDYLFKCQRHLSKKDMAYTESQIYNCLDEIKSLLPIMDKNFLDSLRSWSRKIEAIVRLRLEYKIGLLAAKTIIEVE